MRPLLDNPGRAFKRAAFSVVTSQPGIMGRAVVTDRYRYIRWTGPHPDKELYDRVKAGARRELLSPSPGLHPSRVDVQHILRQDVDVSRSIRERRFEC